MSEATNYKREQRSEARVTEIVKHITHPIHCVEVWNHFAKVWGVSTRTVRIFTTAAMKEKKIGKRAGWYVPVS